MAHIKGELIFNDPNRLNLKFKDKCGTVICQFKSIFTQEDFFKSSQKYFFHKVLGNEKHIFLLRFHPQWGHAGGFGRLLCHIYFNYDPIEPQKHRNKKKIDFKNSHMTSGGPNNRGHSRENELLKSATQVRFWCFCAPMAPQLERKIPRELAETTKTVSRRRGLGRQFRMRTSSNLILT